jgi:hypothetical protein
MFQGERELKRRLRGYSGARPPRDLPPARAPVLNQASGMWQITRETLLYAHRLYLKDTRDYSSLPSRLQPPKELNPDDADPAVLTTHSGLLFRNLLDQFHGDVASAVGAYKRWSRESQSAL